MSSLIVRFILPVLATLGLVGGGVAVYEQQQSEDPEAVQERVEDDSADYDDEMFHVETIDIPSTSVTSQVDLYDHTYSIDQTAIPLGDGKVSTSPKKGYVYSCTTSFRSGGADHAGEWIDGDTWDATHKVSVDGNVSWPSAVFSAMAEGTMRFLSGNGLPVGVLTGIFPIQKSDEAYQYDRNPNSIEEVNLQVSLPANPTIAANASCVPMGAVGYALNGAAIYNALDDAGLDAVAHETQDLCNGHPQGAGQYHYHGPSDCIPNADKNNALIGYALDGFGIYSRFDANGVEYTSNDLDECHGITSEIEWDGEMVTMYHYVLTSDYPYTVGCFRGTPVQTRSGGGPETSGGQASLQTSPQGGGRTPPQAATDACSSKSENNACSFTTPNGTVSGTCRNAPGSTDLACVPN